MQHADEAQDSLPELHSPTTPVDCCFDDDDTMAVSDDDSQLDADRAHAPPPRIAARFYRPPNPRRKSSAQSSRRNSISSTHSHQSGLSAYRTQACQSTHVAQHLRRASILESRKARLADRAAHAEQVRLRAALAKSSPRTSNSEEKALAAQQAREKHLAQVAAACAEEVRRAKKVAEDMKERKAQEEARYRAEMQEKLAEAERRRQEYKRNQRRPRTASVPSSEPKKPTSDAVPPPDDETAARRIQRAWRTRRRRRMVESFLELGLSIDKVHDTSFEDISAQIAEQTVISASANLLNLLALRGSNDDLIGDDPAAIRTFLSAYLILGHPAAVLSSKDGDLEQDLIKKATDLIISFESTLSKLCQSNRYTPPPTQLETVVLAHSAFVTAFSNWKAQDSHTLVEMMVASFVNLDAIWQSVKDDTRGEVANDYRQGIRDNQVILLSKIRKLAGPERANQLIKKAINESRRAKARERRRRPVGDVRPRAAESDSASETSENSSDASASTSADRASRGRDLLQEDASVASQGDIDMEGAQADALAKLFSPMPSNRILVHELAIDKEFRIDEAQPSEVRDALNREICESMKRGFERGEGAPWTTAMADNIRGKLLRLLKPGNSMYKLISEALDPEFVHQQATQGVFSYERFFSFMASILPKLCAPFRDAQVKVLAEELQESGDLDQMIGKLFKLLHIIDLLALDYQNYLLHTMAPTLIKEAPGYEQRAFAQDLENNVITLQKTKCWFSSASVNCLTEADRRDPIYGPPTAQKIYARGLVDLAIAPPPLQESEVPETLALDQARLARIRQDAVKITTVGAILLTAKNLLRRDVRSQWKPEAQRLWTLLKEGYVKEDGSMPAKILSVLESSHAMPPNTRTQLSNTITRLLSQAAAGRLADPVMKVLFQRLKTHILTRISASTSGERVRAATGASEGLATSGLPEFVGQVGDVVEQLTKISEVDRKAHGAWYEQIAAEVERMGSEEETTVAAPPPAAN
ncbi:T-complex 11 [Lasiodiplodia theobromae]|uniref:T-complex protein 11-like protein 2 n=1 Tax=Lasiodiplodia theobromae TaxID=45133 RepID=A0A5N5DB81_9PEZI|nr:IQ calmodulin-binding motif protein [Lasiodiplodia theobromae]KAB2574895.1 T-complex protein 11-like protein 2 [Lasiodiplodia theobromae]KAF4536525.1 IQ calmodulin-binding motif protein [Lasiodiplodia theobromae]KAF9637169.1 T-complex 11 [Lasiodiplodia theobromae]